MVVVVAVAVGVVVGVGVGVVVVVAVVVVVVVVAAAAVVVVVAVVVCCNLVWCVVVWLNVPRPFLFLFISFSVPFSCLFPFLLQSRG